MPTDNDLLGVEVGGNRATWQPGRSTRSRCSHLNASLHSFYNARSLQPRQGRLKRRNMGDTALGELTALFTSTQEIVHKGSGKITEEDHAGGQEPCYTVQRVNSAKCRFLLLAHLICNLQVAKAFQKHGFSHVT